MTRKKNTILPLLAVLIVSLMSSCLKSGLEDFPLWENNKIENAYIEVRFNTNRTYNGEPVVGYQRLNTVSQTINEENATVHLELGIPAASGDFTATTRQTVSLSEVFLYFDISTAATMKGVEGTPNPGFKTDATKPLKYEVTAANGDKRVWTINIDPLPIINKYDGNYTMTGNLVDYAASTITGKYPLNVALVTQSVNSVVLLDLGSNAYRHYILNNGSDSYYGDFAPVFTFDANNNVVSVTNYYGQPAANGRSGQLDPSGTNKWDPATKTLKVKYWMNQPGDTHRTLFDETFTWKD